MNLTKIATKFVDLALKHDWNQIEELSEVESKILFDIVLAAGFEIKEIRPRKLRGDYRDQDGSRTGDSYPINSLCPFSVVNNKDDDYYFATGWLDCALKRVVFGSSRRYEDRAQLIKTTVEEIERSIPLEPIQLTPEGDYLREYPPSTHFGGLEYFVKHVSDEDKFDCCVGVHKYCGGWMDRRNATETQDAIVCRSCHIRILFPKEVETFGDFRSALSF
ncbi:hypothetical protein ACFLZ9_01885 [Patescibacteria group bacterium]